MTISSKDIIITLSVTVALAIVIIVIFIVLSSSKKDDQSQQTSDLIDQIKKQGQGQAQYEDDEDKDGQKDEEDQIEIIKYAGKLVEIEGNTLTILENLEQENISFDIPNDALITRNQEEFEFSDLHVGDELQIITEKDKNKTTIVEVKITLSTSPTVPTQINVPIDTPGVILPPSKRQAL